MLIGFVNDLFFVFLFKSSICRLLLFMYPSPFNLCEVSVKNRPESLCCPLFKDTHKNRITIKLIPSTDIF